MGWADRLAAVLREKTPDADCADCADCPPAAPRREQTAETAQSAWGCFAEKDAVGGARPGILEPASLAGAYSAPDGLADREAIAAEEPGRVAPPSTPPADLVERLAAAMAAPRPWQRVAGDPAPALAYFMGQARRRLAPLDGLARGRPVPELLANLLAMWRRRAAVALLV